MLLESEIWLQNLSKTEIDYMTDLLESAPKYSTDQRASGAEHRPSILRGFMRRKGQGRIGWFSFSLVENTYISERREEGSWVYCTVHTSRRVCPRLVVIEPLCLALWQSSCSATTYTAYVRTDLT